MQVLAAHSGAVNSVSFSHDGTRLVSGGKDGRVILFSVTGPAPIRVVEMADTVWAAAFSPLVEVAAIGLATGLVLLMPNAEPKRLPSPYAQTPAAALSYCDNGRTLIVGYGQPNDPTAPGFLVVHLSGEHREIARRGATHGVTAVAASPRGKRVLWGGGDKRVTRWDLTAQDHHITQPHRKEIRAIALSPDGRQFAATDDYDIRIYDTETMQLQRSIMGHKGRLDALAYTPDGRLLSGAWDKTVRLWEPDTGAQLAAHDWGVGNVRTVAVSPDGLLAAAAGDRGTIVLWDLDS